MTHEERRDCAHEDFAADCEIARITDAGAFVVHVRVACSVCGEPFRFLKLPPGISMQSPCVNIDGTIASLPIEPEGQKRLFSKMTVQMPKLPEKV